MSCMVEPDEDGDEIGTEGQVPTARVDGPTRIATVKHCP